MYLFHTVFWLSVLCPKCLNHIVFSECKQTKYLYLYRSMNLRQEMVFAVEVNYWKDKRLWVKLLMFVETQTVLIINKSGEKLIQ